MAQFAVSSMPEGPVAAAAEFHRRVLPGILELLAREPDQLTLLFDEAGHDHAIWRRAAIEGLAREHAPIRVNALVGGDKDAIDAGLAYIACATGLTGQVLPLDGTGAGKVLYTGK